MSQRIKLKDFSTNYADTFTRFPLTILLLAAAFVTNIIAIYQGEELYARLMVTFLLGASIYSVFQLIYERFYTIPTIRYFFMGVTLVLSYLYYLFVGNDIWRIEITVKTMVLFFILLIAFLWIPSMKSRINFNESFLAAFKAFFVSAFFYSVLLLGVIIIIAATDLLLMNVREESYAYAVNLILILLAPIHFLALIPYYPNSEEMNDPSFGELKKSTTSNTRKEDLNSKQNHSDDNTYPDQASSIDTDSVLYKIKYRREELLIRQITPVKLLEALITYVIIPLTAIFTIILLLYILMNITGEFWTDSLMEPLLVSYSITVIIVYLLASTIFNTVTKYFRRIFPKVLVVVVLFQTISSFIRTVEVGITYGRYYAIMFGVFATIAGIYFSIKPIQKNGLIAPVLILLSCISVLPFLDAFSVSKLTQIHRLESTLEKNDMLVDEKIIPKGDISDKDKKAIISSLQYLNQLDYTKEVEWLRDYAKNYDFGSVFGFEEYEQVQEESIHISINREPNTPIPITGYDFIIRTNLYLDKNDLSIGQFEKEGIVYQLKQENNTAQTIVLESGDSELITFDTSSIYNKFTNSDQLYVADAKTEEVTFIEDNSVATLTIVAENININKWQDEKSEQADIYILVKIK